MPLIYDPLLLPDWRGWQQREGQAWRAVSVEVTKDFVLELCLPRPNQVLHLCQAQARR